MQSPKRRRSTKTTKKRQTSKEDAFRLKAEPLLEALDSAIFQFCAKMNSGIEKVGSELSEPTVLVAETGFEPVTFGL